MFLRWGTAQVDLFASKHNSQLPVFMSLILDPAALIQDALSVSWAHLDAYGFPPFALLAKVLRKAKMELCVVTPVAPYWPESDWFPELLDLLIDFPRSLPVWPDLLSHNGLCHPDPAMFHLHAWRLSNNLTGRRDFLAKLPLISPHSRERALWPFTMPNGESLAIGAVGNRLVLSRPLYPS